MSNIRRGTNVPEKSCTKCKTVKEIECFRLLKNGRRDSWCTECNNKQSQKRYSENIESVAEYGKKYYRENKEHHYKVCRANAVRNKEKANQYNRDRYTRIRKEFISMYGGKCQCCGEAEMVFLTIDHIRGQIGVKEKETGEIAYVKAMKNYNPSEYRILCMNCNSATRFGRTCPHQLIGVLS